MPSPEGVLQHVRAAFEREPRIDLHRYPVRMTFKDGILTLDGEVEHIVAKKLSLDLAATVPGMDGLVDRAFIRFSCSEIGDPAFNDGGEGTSFRFALGG